MKLEEETDLQMVDRWRRHGACLKDAAERIAEMKRRGLLKKNVDYTKKALRLLGTRPGSWFCELHGLNGLDVPTKAQRERDLPCVCPGRQDR